MRDIEYMNTMKTTIHIAYLKGVARHRSHFQISITLSNFNVSTKFNRWITKKGWEFFVILIEKKCYKKAVSSPCSSDLVKISMTGVTRHRSHFQISITFLIFNILTKCKRWNTKKGWEMLLILIQKKCCKNAVFSSCSSAVV